MDLHCHLISSGVSDVVKKNNTHKSLGSSYNSFSHRPTQHLRHATFSLYSIYTHHSVHSTRLTHLPPSLPRFFPLCAFCIPYSCVTLSSVSQMLYIRLCVCVCVIIFLCPCPLGLYSYFIAILPSIHLSVLVTHSLSTLLMSPSFLPSASFVPACLLSATTLFPIFSLLSSLSSLSSLQAIRLSLTRISPSGSYIPHVCLYLSPSLVILAERERKREGGGGGDGCLHRYLLATACKRETIQWTSASYGTLSQPLKDGWMDG